MILTSGQQARAKEGVADVQRLGLHGAAAGRALAGGRDVQRLDIDAQTGLPSPGELPDHGLLPSYRDPQPRSCGQRGSGKS